MSYRFLQGEEIQRTAVTTSDLAFGSSVTAGSLLVVATSVWQATVSGVSWTVGGSATPTLAVNSSTAVNARVRIFYAENASAGAHTARVTLSASNDVTVAIAEYSGIATAGALDVTQAQNSSVNAATITSTATGTLAQARNLVFSVTNHDTTNATPIYGTDLHTREVDPVNNVGMCLAIGDKRSQSTAGQTVTWTYGVSVAWRLAVAVFKEASSSDPDEPVLVACGTASSAASGNITPANPTHTTDDILLLKVHSSDNVSHTVTGWTQIAQQNNTTLQRVSLWYLRATAAGTTNPTVTHTAGGPIIGQVDVWRGCITSGSPVRGSSLTTGTGDAVVDTTAVSSLSLNDTLAFVSFYEDDPTTATQPLDWVAPVNGVQTTTSGTDAGLYTRWRRLEAAGASDAPSITLSGGTFTNSAHTGAILALQPAAAGTTYPVTPAGTLTLAGTLVRQDQDRRAGTLTTAGANALVLTAQSAYQAEVALDGPVAHWRAGEGNGTEAADVSGNGHAGDYLGGYTLAQTGALVGDADTAVNFNGSTGRIEVSPVPMSVTDEWTIEAWVKPDTLSPSTAGCICSVGTDAGGYALMMSNAASYGNGGSDLVMVINSWGWADSGYNFSSTTDYVHVVLRRNPPTGTVAFFVNGQAVGTPASVGNTTPSLRLHIGAQETNANNGTMSRWFDGNLDEVAIYDYALSDSRILDHYEVGTGTGGGISPAGTLTTAGALTRMPLLVRGGTLTTAGATAKQTQARRAGALTPAGALAAVKSKLVAPSGTLTTVGALTRTTTRALSGTLTSAGALLKQTQARRGGALTPTGATAFLKSKLLALTGTLSTAGGISRQVAKSLTATATTAGAVVKATTRALTGALTPTGALTVQGPATIPFRDDFTSAIAGEWTETDTASLISVVNGRAYFDNGGSANWTDHHLTLESLPRANLGAFCALVRLTNYNTTGGGALVSLSPSTSDPAAAGNASIATNNQGSGNNQLWAQGLRVNDASSRSIDYLWAVVPRPGGGFFTLVSGGEYGAFPTARLVNVSATETDATLHAHLATKQAAAHFGYAATLATSDLPTALTTRFGAAVGADDFTASNGTTVSGRSLPYGTGTWSVSDNTVEVQGNAAAISVLGKMIADVGTAPRVIEMTFDWSGSGSVEMLFRGDGTYTNTWNMWYWSGNGAINFERASSGGGGTVASSGAYDPVVGTNTFRVIDYGDRLEGFLNGTLALSFTSSNNNTESHIGAASGEGTQTILDIAAWPATVALSDDFGPFPDIPAAAGSPTVTDAFTDTDGTNLPTHHADWTVHSGTWEVNSNRARMTTAGVSGSATRSTPSANHQAQSLIGIPADPGAYPTDVFAGVLVRRSASNTYVHARYLWQDGPSPEVEVWENNAGTQTLVGYVNISDVLTGAGDHTLALAALDSEVAAYHDGELVAQATVSVTATGRAGIGVLDTNPGGQPTWDDFQIAPTVESVTYPVTVGGTLTTSGARAQQGQKSLAGTATTSGSLVKQDRRSLAGSLTGAGALVKATTRAFAGTLATAGALAAVKGKLVALAGTLTTAGALRRTAGKALTGALSPAGALRRATTRALAGGVTPTGALRKATTRTAAGALTTAGTLATELANAVLTVDVGGTLATAGAFVKRVGKALAGLLTPLGLLQKESRPRQAGTLTTSGATALSRTLARSAAGTLTTSGALATTRIQHVTAQGTLGLSGSLTTVLTLTPPPPPPEGTPLAETLPAEFLAAADAGPTEGGALSRVAPTEFLAAGEAGATEGGVVAKGLPPEFRLRG